MKLRLCFFILSVVLAGILTIFPTCDIIVSGEFYQPGEGFIYAKTPFVLLIFRAVPWLVKIFAVLGGGWVLFLWYRNGECAKSPIVFLLLAALLGPALTVNYALKEHSGRARPRDIVEFGGTKQFTAAMAPASQCAHNCSFSSGHAAMGFYFTALSWIAPIAYQTPVFLLTFLFGSIVGFGRILQGGHFFSDVVFSFVIIMIINEACFRLWKYALRK